MAKKNMTMRNRKNKTEGGKRKDRKNKTEGGDRKNKTRKNKTEGGKRKLSNGAKTWQKSVMAVYKELKAKDSNTKLKDAMVEAAKRKKKGQL